MTDKLTTLFIYVILAAMWNALAGYAGLVSVGQQAFFGLGAYGAIKLVDQGVGVYPSLVLGALLAGALSIPIALVMLRLRGGEFAIGMWVVAEVCFGLVILDQSVGGATGTSLIGLNAYSPHAQRSYNYWLALGSMVVLLLLLLGLLRSRTGASLQAIRDDEDAAGRSASASSSARASCSCSRASGARMAGALYLATNITFQPGSLLQRPAGPRT